MSDPTNPLAEHLTVTPRDFARVIFGLIVSLLFALAYTQAPLYYSNQNQYFLHGLAKNGLGHLDRDWLANTADPTPVFSMLLAVYKLPHYAYMWQVVFLVYYVGAMGRAFRFLTSGKVPRVALIVFVTLLTIIHSGLLRLLCVQMTGVDYPWYFQSGLAAQYILGFGLQPSVAGVFLVASIISFLADHPYRAAIWLGLAAIIHPTYLLVSGILTVAYMFVLLRERRWKSALGSGGLALLIVSLILIYTVYHFGPTNATTFAEAQRLLARVRIPHHTSIRSWCDGIALLQVGWMVLAIVLVRGTRLFGVLATVFAISFGLTVVQFFLDSDTLALLFPWRTSAVLVPISTAIILTRMIQKLGPWLTRRSHGQQIVIWVACMTVLVGLTGAGIAIGAYGWGYQSNSDEVELLDFVKANKQPGDVYLLPVEIPKLATGRRGAYSTNFTPAPRSGKDAHDIAVDLQRFRLYTGAPIFVDFKAVPYKDVEVLEWYRRLQWAAKAYQSRNWDEGETLTEAIGFGITHVVVPTNRDIQSRRFVKAYEDRFYRVYRIEKKDATLSWKKAVTPDSSDVIPEGPETPRPRPAMGRPSAFQAASRSKPRPWTRSAPPRAATIPRPKKQPAQR